MLTQKQKELLIFIHERAEQGDIAPSFDEMKDHLGLKSKSGVHRLITGLVERGFLERLPHRARALEVVKLPAGYGQDTTSPSVTTVTPFPSVNASAVSTQDNNKGSYDKSVETIPLYGKIAAGTPIEAIRHEGDTVNIPGFLLGSSEYYALEVDGDSMINAGIHDGDVVIIERTSHVRDGDIIVALVDGEEVTLKRLKRERGTVVLIPENPAYELRVLEADRVEIQGKLASLYRTYH